MSNDAAPTPKVGPRIAVSLEQIIIEFPAGFWDDPSLDLQLSIGGSKRDAFVAGVGMKIVEMLQRKLQERQQASPIILP